jgi:hypothetical protein
MKQFWQYVALAVAVGALVASIYNGIAAGRFVNPTRGGAGKSTAFFFTRKAPHDFIGIGYRLYERHVAALAIAVGALFVAALIGHL